LNSRVTIRQNISSAVQRAWLNRGPLACLLWPVSLLFGLLVKGRRLLYQAGFLKSVRVGVPASKRIQAAQALLDAYPATQLLICDDGLQHYALARDIEMAVFDDRGTGNGWLLPAGPLREPWPQRLHSGISLVLHTGSKPAFDGYIASRKLADHAVAADGRKVTLQSLQAQSLVALAAIAHPEAFFTMLKERGLSLAETIALPDHDDFADYALPVKNGATLLCTEKDAVKLFGSPEMAAVNLLAVALEFAPEPAFLEALDALLAPLLSASRLSASLLSQLPSAHGH